MAENAYREIITKAVCGKGKKFSQSAHTVTPTHKPSNILGCWVINHKYKTTYHKDAVIVEGTYDINTWYSFNNNTKTEVVCETVNYRDRVPLTLRDKQVVSDHVDVACRPLQEPNCLEAKISPNGNRVVAQVEREFLVEVIGETKVKVRVDDDGLVEAVDEEENEEELDKELDSLDSEFLTDDDKEDE
ncbi:outer spore coat protein CotE [Sporolactobacillus laevolacticus]|uniref:outer spore coat protein CotE n=1 Tax=Sporolactobacillus laevolacticus TaxID=33018 RepID=UPI0025B31A1E|nr:outer spore coat protein CotE [Sporolactobacillus laevolacticus]MDN3953929.1 outer spore coat protein CotE [Sporolactobacillus laevolacticus]